MKHDSHQAPPLEVIPKVLRGEVRKVNLAQKMIKVVIKRRIKHPRYGKFLSRETVLNVHWEGEERLEVGDSVAVIESRPISKIKHHVFLRKIKSVGTGPEPSSDFEGKTNHEP